jgi:cytochrome P450
MNHKIPPTPSGHWLLGNLPEFRRDILGMFARASKEYGDIVRLRLPNLTAYLLTHPNDIEYVLVTANKNFKKHKVWKHLSDLFGTGLLTSEGDFWIRQRRLAQPAFHRSRIASYGKTMVDFTNRMLQQWKDGAARDVHHDMMDLTMQIVAKTLFNADVGSESKEIGHAMEVVMQEFSSRFGRPFILPSFIPTPGNIRFNKAVKKFDEIIYKIIQARSGTHDKTGDLLSMLLNAVDEDGSRMTDTQLRDELITLFLAGHETTAIALSWTWYLLSTHPDVEFELTNEIETVLGDREVTVDDLPKLRYAEMVILESMRIYPPAYGFGREALNDCEIGGYHVPAGTTIFMSQYVTQRDARFFPEPLEFRPERWENDLMKKIPRYAYFPFSGGPRQCIGNSFAMMEAILIMVTIVRNFELHVVPDHPIALHPSITLRPKYGMKMNLKKREKVINHETERRLKTL